MPKQLTDALVKGTSAPAGGRLELSDTVRPGLRLRIYSTGRRVWMFEKRVKGGRKRKHTLGTYPELSIKDARGIALEIELEASKGIDRIEDAAKMAAAKEQAALNATKVHEALSAFNTLHLDNLRTGKSVASALRSAFADRMEQDISTLRRRDLQAMIDAKAATGAKVRANRLKAFLSKFAKFSYTRGYINDDIGRGLEKAVRERPRERVLSLAEIREIWAATFSLSDLTGPLVRLLILTAQRRSEIANLVWDEVDFQSHHISLKGKRMKNGNGHLTHLSEPALEELRIRRKLSKCELVFSFTQRTPVTGFTKIKELMDRQLPADFEPWRFHDFRTSFATIMAELGEPESVVDRILNHAASGSAPSAVARVYNRSQHLPARQRILDRWADIIIDDSSGCEVIELNQKHERRAR